MSLVGNAQPDAAENEDFAAGRGPAGGHARVDRGIGAAPGTRSGAPRAAASRERLHEIQGSRTEALRGARVERPAADLPHRPRRRAGETGSPSPARIDGLRQRRLLLSLRTKREEHHASAPARAGGQEPVGAARPQRPARDPGTDRQIQGGGRRLRQIPVAQAVDPTDRSEAGLCGVARSLELDVRLGPVPGRHRDHARPARP